MEEKKTLGSMLVEYGIITEQDLEEGLVAQKETGGRIGAILISMGKATQRDIDYILSKQLDIPFIIPDERSIDPELLVRFPKDFLLTNCILPMYATADEVAIATDDPFNKDAFEKVEKITGKSVILSAANRESITEILIRVLRGESAPELTENISSILRRLQGSCFYRIDFHLRADGLDIDVFGFGIKRNVFTTASKFKAPDIAKALSALGLRYFHEDFESDGCRLMLVYPVGDTLATEASPVILGCHGLSLPSETLFSDTPPVGMTDVFLSDAPPSGYRRICLRSDCGISESVIYTIDTAPGDFMNCYVKVSLPQRCSQCGGAGCVSCLSLGYTFRHVEGIYSRRDLTMLMREG